MGTTSEYTESPEQIAEEGGERWGWRGDMRTRSWRVQEEQWEVMWQSLAAVPQRLPLPSELLLACNSLSSANYLKSVNTRWTSMYVFYFCFVSQILPKNIISQKIMEGKHGDVLNSRWFVLCISASLTKLCSDDPLLSLNFTFLPKIAHRCFSLFGKD